MIYIVYMANTTASATQSPRRLHEVLTAAFVQKPPLIKNLWVAQMERRLKSKWRSYRYEYGESYDGALEAALQRARRRNYEEIRIYQCREGFGCAETTPAVVLRRVDTMYCRVTKGEMFPVMKMRQPKAAPLMQMRGMA